MSEFTTSFKTVPFSTLEERAPFSSVTEDIEVSDLFGRAPGTGKLHEGDLTFGEDVFFWPDAYGYYVIAGSVEVAGSLFFAATDMANVIIVTGDLKARNLLVAEEAQLYVNGRIQVDNLVVSHVSDGGALSCKAGASARAFVDLGRHHHPSFQGGVRGPSVGRGALLPEFEGMSDDKLFDAIKDGKDVLRPDAYRG